MEIDAAMAVLAQSEGYGTALGTAELAHEHAGGIICRLGTGSITCAVGVVVDGESLGLAACEAPQVGTCERVRRSAEDGIGGGLEHLARADIHGVPLGVRGKLAVDDACAAEWHSTLLHGLEQVGIHSLHIHAASAAGRSGRVGP